MAAEAPRKASSQILSDERNEALDALNRSTAQLFFSGAAAGLEIGFSLFLMATVHELCAGQLPAPVVQLLMANMYSFGFVLVVLGRSELFTEQTSLAVMPVISGQASFTSLIRLWSVIFVANVLGAGAFACAAAFVGPALGTFDAETLGSIAHRMTDHPAIAIVCSGILAGWLMGLLSWVVAAGRDTISQIVIVWLVTAAIGLAQLHHVVLGSAEVLAGVFANTDVTIADFGHFLLWTTVGNALGGPFFVALLKSVHSSKDQSRQTQFSFRKG
ncbi:MAG TPA: formate/nitrite transporter family protein [Pirellulales bacterium]|jgi:formate/nitrite transporter FocA (FNT family)